MSIIMDRDILLGFLLFRGLGILLLQPEGFTRASPKPTLDLDLLSPILHLRLHDGPVMDFIASPNFRCVTRRLYSTAFAIHHHDLNLQHPSPTGA